MLTSLLESATPPPPKQCFSISNSPPTRNPSTVSFPEPLQTTHRSVESTITGTSPTQPSISPSVYAKVLDSCDSPRIVGQVHAHALRNGFRGHEFVETKLLQAYGACDCLEYAVKLFDEMPSRNLYSWAAVIGAFEKQGLFDDALGLFRELLAVEGVELEFFLFPVLFRLCSGVGDVGLGRQVHGMAIKGKHLENAFVGNALIDMYGKCGSFFDAKRGLESMSTRDLVSWNSLITACAVNRMADEALNFLEEMHVLDGLVPNLVTWSAVIGGLSQNGHDEEAVGLLFRMTREGFEPNARTLASVLPSCSRLKELNLGREIHGYVTRHGFTGSSYVVNGLLDLYRRCGDMKSAEFVFWKLSVRNEVSYNTMIVGYSENGQISEARELFDRMEAQGVKKSKISWNSMISGYVDNCLYDKAWDLYIHLLAEDEIEPDSFTLGSVVTACADTASLKRGKEIHSHVILKGLQADPFVGGSLVELYGRCDELASAQLAFDQLRERDTSTWNALISGYSRCNETKSIDVLLQRMKQDGLEPNIYTWNSIISGYVENGHHDAAMSLFSDMCSSSSNPDAFAISMVITACSRFATIDRGKQIHGHSIRRGFDSDIYIAAALIDMYAKCGSIKHAKHVYDGIGNPNLVAQNAMLTAYAMHGLGEQGISLFRKMLVDGYIPDHVTFLAALSSCAHAGTVTTGWEFFYLMKRFGAKPSLKHYTCMVDLLGRVGRLAEAYSLISLMPMEPDAVVWNALLGGCVVNGDIVLGEIAGKRLLELGADNTGNYILLANLYGLHGRWSDLARMRQKIKDRDMQKSPGCSWIEQRDTVHVFLSVDMSHDRTVEIYSTLDSLTAQMRLHTEVSV